ncbi:hypothetical protein EV360DRAFT_85703 [Lentinula raphanica]|nr:hypothetical protein EV360DRAFT_85703 [Lentinula raphanica]
MVHSYGLSVFVAAVTFGAASSVFAVPILLPTSAVGTFSNDNMVPTTTSNVPAPIQGDIPSRSTTAVAEMLDFGSSRSEGEQSTQRQNVNAGGLDVIFEDGVHFERPHYDVNLVEVEGQGRDGFDNDEVLGHIFPDAELVMRSVLNLSFILQSETLHVNLARQQDETSGFPTTVQVLQVDPALNQPGVPFLGVPAIPHSRSLGFNAATAFVRRTTHASEVVTIEEAYEQYKGVGFDKDRFLKETKMGEKIITEMKGKSEEEISQTLENWFTYFNSISRSRSEKVASRPEGTAGRR